VRYVAGRKGASRFTRFGVKLILPMGTPEAAAGLVGLLHAPTSLTHAHSSLPVTKTVRGRETLGLQGCGRVT
jgi:hypothetical protein